MPAPLGEAAYYGLAGEFTLVVAGAGDRGRPGGLALSVSRRNGFDHRARAALPKVGAAKHFTNLFMVIVGNSAKARKGTSWGEVHAACELVDLKWWKRRITSGLSTGEGLIHAVRDEIRESVPIKEKGGKVAEYQEQVTDPGEADKRLLREETESGAGAAIPGARWQHALSGDPPGMGWETRCECSRKTQGRRAQSRTFPSLGTSRMRSCKGCFRSPMRPMVLRIAFFGCVPRAASVYRSAAKWTEEKLTLFL